LTLSRPQGYIQVVRKPYATPNPTILESYVTGSWSFMRSWLEKKRRAWKGRGVAVRVGRPTVQVFGQTFEVFVGVVQDKAK